MSGTDNGKLSVTMNCYNHDKFVGKAIKAILTQSRRPDEFIIVNDASTDRSADVIEEAVGSDPIATIVHNKKNLGAIGSRRIALEMATGEYLYNAASDDMVLQGFFKNTLNLLEQYPEAGLCSSMSLAIDAEDRNIGLSSAPIIASIPCYIPPARVSKLLLKYGSWYLGNTAIWRRSKHKEAGGTIPQIDAFTDSFIFHIVALRYGACYIPEVYTAWRVMEEGFSNVLLADEAKYDEAAKNYYNMLLEFGELVPDGYPNKWRNWNDYGVRYKALQRASRDKGVAWKSYAVIKRLGLALKYGLIRPSYIWQKILYHIKNYDAGKVEISVL